MGSCKVKSSWVAADLVGKLAFQRNATGLVVTLSATKPCDHAFTLKISGFDLAASEPKMAGGTR
jgi:hypothetical protein